MMYFDEHNPPHIHAFYGSYEAAFSISSGDIIRGNFPTNGKRLVKEFIIRYRNELMIMWETKTIKKLKAIK